MRPRRGFALLASVWLVVAISAVGLEVAWLARTRRLATANALEGEQARVAAASGLEHARARLANVLAAARHDALADPWRHSLGGATAVVGTAQYAFTIRDDAASLDPNVANEAMLARLFVACGADLPEASAAAQRIADWKDADQLRRARGAERDDYLGAAARTLPRDGAVQESAELDDVIGLPAAPWACVRPLLTVGGTGRINPNTASAEVLQTLPGIDAAAAAAIVIARRIGGRLHDFRELAAAVPAALRGDVQHHAEALQRLLVYETDAVRVTSEARIDGSPVRVSAEALMRRNGSAVFVEWRAFR